jgi:hypothetical protein
VLPTDWRAYAGSRWAYWIAWGGVSKYCLRSYFAVGDSVVGFRPILTTFLKNSYPGSLPIAYKEDH